MNSILKVSSRYRLILTLMYLTSAAFIPSFSAQENYETNEFSVQYYISDPNIYTDDDVLCLGGVNESYELITIPELGNRYIPGEPIIPFKTAKILVPMGTEVRDVEVIPGEQKYLGKFLIAPGQNVVPIGFNNMSELEFLSGNEAIYNSTNPYPEQFYSIIGIQNKCGYDILYINLYPIRYIPKTGDTYHISEFDIKVTTNPLEKLDRGLFRGAPQDREVVNQMVDNPETITTYIEDFELIGSSRLLDEDYDYVIITSQMLKDAPEPNFQTLAEWKNSRGVKTAIITVEDIYEEYRYSFHQEPQELIRNFIRDVYLHNNVTYILLGGDGDGARIGGETLPDNTVPSRSLCCCWKYQEDPPSIASDLYYACLNGTFNV